MKFGMKFIFWSVAVFCVILALAKYKFDQETRYAVKGRVGIEGLALLKYSAGMDIPEYLEFCREAAGGQNLTRVHDNGFTFRADSGLTTTPTTGWIDYVALVKRNECEGIVSEIKAAMEQFILREEQLPVKSATIIVVRQNPIWFSEVVAVHNFRDATWTFEPVVGN